MSRQLFWCSTVFVKLHACYDHIRTLVQGVFVCLQVLHVGRKLPITITLQNIIEKSFPEEYALRKAEVAAQEQGHQPGGPETPLPLFVMSCMMPGGFAFCLSVRVFGGMCTRDFVLRIAVRHVGVM
jgi:hypothetical protein